MLTNLYFILVLLRGVQGGPCEQLHDVLSHAGMDFANMSSSNCSMLSSPEANSLSGGWCLASLVSGGWYRTSVVNPVVRYLLYLDESVGEAPIATASSSGGTMFVVRYFVYRKGAAEYKWAYPCYLMAEELKEVCYFHSNFGQICDACMSHVMKTVYQAYKMVMKPIIKAYGGPLGVAATYSAVYFPFLADLGLGPNEKNFRMFWNKYSHWTSRFERLSNWIVATTQANPKEADQGPYFSYGFTSFLSRGMFCVTTDGRPIVDAWYTNYSIYTVTTISANAQSAKSMEPFSLLANPWSIHASPGATWAPKVQLCSMVFSYVMVQKMRLSHVVMSTTLAPGCRSTACILLDGGVADTLPLTPNLAYMSRLAAYVRPAFLMVSGPASTFGTIKYLMGIGPAADGLNTCKEEAAICEAVEELKSLMVSMMSIEMGMQFDALNSIKEHYNTQAQVMSPFCGDPLVLDNFKGDCESNGLCHVFIQLIPGAYTSIAYTVEPMTTTLLMLLISATPVSSRFVKRYIPQAMLRQEYYHSMDEWFPNFAATAKEKGGIAFTLNAGHSLMDFMTFLAQRLFLKIMEAKVAATRLHRGFTYLCGYTVYQEIEKLNKETLA